MLCNGQRLRGELFYDESVQKVLKNVLHLFTIRVKYPRTHHLPWSDGGTPDDRWLSDEDIEKWNGQEYVVTEKMDGENTTMYRDGLHARSLDYEAHISRGRVKALHAQVRHDIPGDWRICGENLTAKHSIYYSNLPSFFMVYSIWERDLCLPWDLTVLYAKVLGLHTVPALWRGVWPGSIYVQNAVKQELRKRKILTPNSLQEVEGYVCRPAGEFPMSQFRKVVGKYVRPAHVQTHGHWMRSRVTWNHWEE